jgi:uncharacterized protein YfaS (alpha-2-macroglobulin family)
VAAAVPVKPISPSRTHAWAGFVTDSARVRIAIPAGADMSQSRVTLRLGQTPTPVIELALNHALRYPFDCSEQLASHLRVLSSVRQLQRAGFSFTQDSAVVRREIDRLVQVLARRVNDDGTVRYWEIGTWSTPWLSAFVGLSLVEAKGAGAQVDDGMLRRISNAARRRTTDTTFTLGTITERARLTEQRLGAQLASVWLQHQMKSDSTNAVDRLFDRRMQLTWEDRAWLAELLHEKARVTAARTVLQELWSSVRRAGILVDVPESRSSSGFPSAITASARLLAATLKIAPEQRDIARLAERVSMHGRSSSAYEWNTQDYAWATPALMQFVQAMPASDASMRVRDRAGEWAMNAPARQVRDTTIDLSRSARRVGDSLVVSLTLRSQAASGAYAAVSVLEVPSTLVRTPDRRGLTVERWIERYADGVPITSVDEGELVRVRLRITAPARRDFVALEDWLPAGLEVVDPSLRISSSLAAFDDVAANEAALLWLESESGELVASHPSAFWFGPWDYRELRDDKVRWFARQLDAGTHTVSYVARATTSGRFARPPAHAEEMYNPGVNGRSDGGWFGVKSR